jgi:hypothetical protein
MPEVEHPEPIPTQAQRMAAVAEMHAYKNLLAHLDSEGLQLVRNRLKDLDLVRLCGSGNLAETRADLLSDTCRLLVAGGVAPAVYFVHAGDMLPDVPDEVPDFGAAEGVK